MSSQWKCATHIDCRNNFKLVIVGDSGVGKSCFLSRYTKSKFTTNFCTTIGVDYACCDVNVNGSDVRLQVWDTAGQERFRAITMSFYRQSHGVFLVYDCCDMKSLENIKSIWLPDIRRHCNKDAKIVLVANKVDNLDLARKKGTNTELIRAEAKAFAEQEGMQFIETSAKDDSNIDTAFLSLATELKKQAMSKCDTPTLTDAQRGFHIDPIQPPRSVFGKLCYFFSRANRRRRHARRQYR